MTTEVILVLPVVGLHSRPSLIPPDATNVKVYTAFEGEREFINVSYELKTDGMFITYDELERRFGMIRCEGFREGERFALRQVESMLPDCDFAVAGTRESDMCFGIRTGRKQALWDVIQKLGGER